MFTRTMCVCARVCIWWISRGAHTLENCWACFRILSSYATMSFLLTRRRTAHSVPTCTAHSAPTHTAIDRHVPVPTIPCMCTGGTREGVCVCARANTHRYTRTHGSSVARVQRACAWCRRGRHGIHHCVACTPCNSHIMYAHRCMWCLAARNALVQHVRGRCCCVVYVRCVQKILQPEQHLIVVQCSNSRAAAVRGSETHCTNHSRPKTRQVRQ